VLVDTVGGGLTVVVELPMGESEPGVAIPMSM
jgi:hypothetical protein